MREFSDKYEIDRSNIAAPDAPNLTTDLDWLRRNDAVTTASFPPSGSIFAVRRRWGVSEIIDARHDHAEYIRMAIGLSTPFLEFISKHPDILEDVNIRREVSREEMRNF